jgi:protein-disulfide isomerase
MSEQVTGAGCQARRTSEAGTDPTSPRSEGWKRLRVRTGIVVLIVGCLTVLTLLPGRVGSKESFPWFAGDVRTRGNPRAPVTLIEYSDFTCGYCKKFFFETWPQIHTKYVETGKLRFLYRDYPRASQGPGFDAAVAARCAGDQGRYWPMHDRLFGGRLDQAEFQRHAKTIGLDLVVFTKCLREAPHTDDIFRDKDEGIDLGFRGTPGFLVLRTEGTAKEPAVAIPGAFPFEVFDEQIDRLLKLAARK